MNVRMMIKDVVKKQRSFFQTNASKSYQFRKKVLVQLYDAIVSKQEAIEEALYLDLNKSKHEAYLTEIGLTLKEIRFFKKHLKKWMKAKKVKTEIYNFPAKSYQLPTAYGVVLIMSPWNYPFYLTMAPLIGALASGNTAIVKPSNYAHHTADLIEKIMHDLFSEDYVKVIKGGREENQALLDQKFDYIFFTGSTKVGKIVMEKAAKNLTPVTLELGGKSPTIVAQDANIDLAAKRIAFGKLINVGQTCIAPDYLLVHEDIKDEFIDKLKDHMIDFVGKEPIKNTNYGKIINQDHFERLVNLMQNQHLIYGGDKDQSNLKISPTILDEVSLDDDIMQEEIFGPLLPIITFKNLDETVKIINSKPHPLALYLFTKSNQAIQKILDHCQFGGACINDTLTQVTSDYLPFGGVGQSGMGQYHGKASFNTFTHHRRIVKQSHWFDIPLKYMPFTKKKMKMIKRVLK